MGDFESPASTDSATRAGGIGQYNQAEAQARSRCGTRTSAEAPTAELPGAASATGIAATVSAPAVVVGADRLVGEYAYLIRGNRLALVANHSARLADGSHLADALFQRRDARLVVLFGMEFDIRSNDNSVARDPDVAIDGATGLTKYSLYGEHHKPTPARLSGVSVIVFDIQDAVLDRLVAPPRLKQMLDAGRTPSEIFAAREGELQRFTAVSVRCRMYRRRFHEEHLSVHIS